MSFVTHFNQTEIKILYCVLNWGLGHATRSIPIIRHLIKADNQLILASDGEAHTLLKKEFPNQKLIQLPSYHIRYFTSNMFLNMLNCLPQLIRAIWNEHIQIRRICKEEKIDLIISDHRLGCFSSLAKSNVVIAHQINILNSRFKPSFWPSKINQWFLKKYDCCLIPDVQNLSNYTGLLTTNIALKNFKYIGPLSRFKFKSRDHLYDLAMVLSGPEPARTQIEKKLLKAASGLGLKSILVRGKPADITVETSDSNLEILDYANSRNLEDILNGSRIVVCRSGYSSIMDLIALRKKALIIPTPGQTEQEYLAIRHAINPLFVTQKESELDLAAAISALT